MILKGALEEKGVEHWRTWLIIFGFWMPFLFPWTSYKSMSSLGLRTTFCIKQTLKLGFRHYAQKERANSIQIKKTIVQIKFNRIWFYPPTYLQMGCSCFGVKIAKLSSYNSEHIPQQSLKCSAFCLFQEKA